MAKARALRAKFQKRSGKKKHLRYSDHVNVYNPNPTSSSTARATSSSISSGSSSHAPSYPSQPSYPEHDTSRRASSRELQPEFHDSHAEGKLEESYASLDVLIR